MSLAGRTVMYWPPEPTASYAPCYTEQTAYEHARIWAELEASGKMIGFYDLIVGATALERGSEVATFNKRHFDQIRGLSVIEPK
jgi:predicted nucleic acid-binding protein